MTLRRQEIIQEGDDTVEINFDKRSVCETRSRTIGRERILNPDSWRFNTVVRDLIVVEYLVIKRASVLYNYKVRDRFEW